MSDISAVVRNAVAWTPFAASFQIPFDVIDGAWLAAAARVIILLATWVVCYLICTWHLRMARSSSGGASAKSGARKRHSAACVPSYPGRRLFGDRVAVGADAVLPVAHYHAVNDGSRDSRRARQRSGRAAGWFLARR